MGRGHGNDRGIGNTAHDEDAPPTKGQCLWHSSPREDYEAPTILSTVVACAPTKHLTIIIIFFFACAMDVNSIWLVGWLSRVSHLPTQKKKVFF